MDLCIIFNHEAIPFVLHGATEAECLRVIEKAKEEFEFRRDEPINRVSPDRIFLHAWSKKAGPKRRLYCLNDKVILETDTKCEDEKESTRGLLAYEHNVAPDRICIVEV